MIKLPEVLLGPKSSSLKSHNIGVLQQWVNKLIEVSLIKLFYFKVRFNLQIENRTIMKGTPLSTNHTQKKKHYNHNYQMDGGNTRSYKFQMHAQETQKTQ